MCGLLSVVARIGLRRHNRNMTTMTRTHADGKVSGYRSRRVAARSPVPEASEPVLDPVPFWACFRVVTNWLQAAAAGSDAQTVNSG